VQKGKGCSKNSKKEMSLEEKRAMKAKKKKATAANRKAKMNSVKEFTGKLGVLGAMKKSSSDKKNKKK
jgi:hypothetical protein